MKKQTVLNTIMVCLIAAIVIGGVLTVGSIQGWFDHDDGSAAVLSEVRGIANIKRDGVAYPAKSNTVLRSGDQLSCEPGAIVSISIGSSRLALGEKAVVEIRDADVKNFSIMVLSGEVFADAQDPISLSFKEQDLVLSDSVSLTSIRTGSDSLSVFRGKAGDTEAGHQTTWLSNETSSRVLPIDSLNPFTIAQLRKVSTETCFSKQALDKLEHDRRIQMQEQINSTSPTVSLEGDLSTTAAAESTGETTLPAGSEATEHTSPADTPHSTQPQDPTQTPSEPKPTEAAPTRPEATEPEATKPHATEPKPTDPKPTSPKPTEPKPTETEPPATTEPAPTEPPAKYVTISIVCDTILNNMDDLEPSKAPYVPDSGVILGSTQVAFTEGETVFDVLRRACDAAGIALEYSWTPMYNSYYIEGINNLYEFDCGSESGWMYKVNGWFPNYGCSAYTLSEGDTIVWCYTCKGLGADVGGSVG